MWKARQILAVSYKYIQLLLISFKNIQSYFVLNSTKCVLKAQTNYKPLKL